MPSKLAVVVAVALLATILCYSKAYCPHTHTHTHLHTFNHRLNISSIPAAAYPFGKRLFTHYIPAVVFYSRHWLAACTTPPTAQRAVVLYALTFALFLCYSSLLLLYYIRSKGLLRSFDDSFLARFCALVPLLLCALISSVVPVPHSNYNNNKGQQQ